jgi:hypothetical protein
MPRTGLVLLLASFLAAPGSAIAQTRPATMLPVPPLPQIGLPLPHIGLPPPAEVSKPSGDHRRPTPGRPPGGRHHRGLPVLPLVITPIYIIEAPSTAAPPPADAHDAGAPESATLRLEIEPSAESQVFVDGYYVGISDGSDDFALTTGDHRVEIRATDYEPASFDVRLSSRQPVTYRARLAPRRASDAAPPSQRKTPMTLYVIPGCYAGNQPPSAVTLPAGCDPALVTTISR